MSALPGDSAPNAFVFPPFMPPVPRSGPAAAPSAPAEPAPDDSTMEVPLPAHDTGDPDGDLPQRGFDAEEADSQQWEAAAPPAAEDFPWLEMPAEGSRVHAAEPAANDDEMAGWAGWDAGDAHPAADLAPAADEGTAAPEEAMPWAESSSEETWTAPADEPAPWTETTVADDPAPWTEPAAEEPMPWTPTPAAEDVAPWAEIPAAEDVAPWAETPAAEEAGPWGDTPASEAAAEPAWPPFIAEAEEAPASQALFARDTPAESAPAPAAQGYGEVADRLEAIARALRDDPASFLAGGSGDALGLLVTGFVLGYGHGRREGGA